MCLLMLIVLIVLMLSACAHPFHMPVGAKGMQNKRFFHQGSIKDNNPSLWKSRHPQVRKFHRYYNRTITVKKSLKRAQPYLPAIVKEFRRRGLPEELAYLPMLESAFLNNADSGSALGMWQFTRQTARHMGLYVGTLGDDRLNWKKSTIAAVRYLEQLGERFNYRWDLALAAYNGGPNYLEKSIKKHHSHDVFNLKLRKETSEYVPKFIAMLQVAKQKYPHLYTIRKKNAQQLVAR